VKHWLRNALYLFALICFSAHATDADVAFFRAVNVDDDRTVRSLLDKGLDPNTSNDQGQSGLFLAMRDDSPKVAAVLLAHPAIHPDAPNAADETPLMMAALRGHAAWVMRLVERGAAINRAGWTALHYACSSAEGAAVVKFLIDKGAAVDAPSPNRTTPLMMAARYGSDAAVEQLLAAGADLRRRNDRNLGAVDFARLGGRERLAAELSKRVSP
jgi:hypothetical protein